MRFLIWFLLIFCRGVCAQVQPPILLTEEDRQNFLFFENSYKKNALLVSEESRIPQVLHFIWLGPADFPSASIQNIKKWIQIHPHWRICFWSDIDRESPVQGMEKRLVEDFHFEELGELFYLSDNFGEKSEILRYELLFQEGGVYIDHDTAPLRSFDALNQSYDFYTGLEVIASSIRSSSVFPSTHLIATKPRHPIIKNSLVWLKNHWEELELFYPGSDSSSIYNRVKHRSSAAFHHGVKGLGSFGNRDIVFPQTYFSESHADQAIYATHQHMGSWHQTNKEHEDKFLKRIYLINAKLDRTTYILIGSILPNLLFLFLLFKRNKYSFLALFLMMSLTSCKKEGTEFENFMGKNTEHWKYITREEDKMAFRFFETLYEKNKHYLSKALFSKKIPQLIHFIWLGPNTFPPQSVENVRTWIAEHPDWRVKFWTDRNRPLPCNNMELCFVKDFQWDFLEKCYEGSYNYGEKSDLLRYEILYKEGGVYVDHDANCLSSFENLHSNFDFYCGLEAPHPPFAGYNITSGNGVLGSRPGHPVVKKVIDIIEKKWEETGKRFKGKDAYSKVELVMQRTYIALTHALKESVARDQNIDIVLPSAYFFAKTGIPSLYSKHFYATAWADTNNKKSAFDLMIDKKLSALQKKGAKMQHFSLALLLLNLLIGFFLLKKKRA